MTTQTEAPVIVRLSGVRKTYKNVVAVDHVDLDVRQGEFFTMLGPSGSGKTTSLRLIAGFELPDEGHVELSGADVTGLPPYARDINTVFQDYALFPHMSVAENIAYGLQAKSIAKDEIGGRVEEALRMVRLEGYGTRSPAQLSGGQRQRVGLARAIVNRPKVLLLDEPLGALDLKLRQQMQSELKSIQAQVGITFIYVTHDQEEALTMSDRIAIFNQGRIVQIGTPLQIYEEPADEFVADFVGTSNILVRGGQRFVLRPEKIFIAPAGEAPTDAGLHVEPARLIEAVYVGQFTRYLVVLEDGSEIIAVRQNFDRTSSHIRTERGTPVQVAWHKESLFAL